VRPVGFIIRIYHEFRVEIHPDLTSKQSA